MFHFVPVASFCWQEGSEIQTDSTALTCRGLGSSQPSSYTPHKNRAIKPQPLPHTLHTSQLHHFPTPCTGPRHLQLLRSFTHLGESLLSFTSLVSGRTSCPLAQKKTHSHFPSAVVEFPKEWKTEGEFSSLLVSWPSCPLSWYIKNRTRCLWAFSNGLASLVWVQAS